MIDTGNHELFDLSPAQQSDRLRSLVLTARPPSRSELELIINPLRPAYLAPWAYQHGLGHGTACAIWAALFCRRLNLSPHFTRLAVITAYLHDARRWADFEPSEYRHAWRGREYVQADPAGLIAMLVPDPIEREAIAQAIGTHSLTSSQRRSRDRLREEYHNASDDQVALIFIGDDHSLSTKLWLILTDVDVLDLVRGFYAGPVLAPVLRSVRRLRRHTVVLRDRPGIVDQRAIFPQIRALQPHAHALAHFKALKRDADPQEAALNAAVHLGIIGP